MNTSQLDLNTILTFTQSLAREAGGILREAYDQPRKIEHKGVVNLVTEVDHAAEAHIVDRLKNAYPDFDILAEEGRSSQNNHEYLWVIDPLDGTNNFAHGLPAFAVSICLRHKTTPLLGVTYDPLRDECFSAITGQGAHLNGNPIRVSQTPELQRGLIATEFPYNRHTTEDNNAVPVATFLRKAQGIRRIGSACLDLAYVACGRLDGYWEQQLEPWDIATGILLVREAGGTITDYSGSTDNTRLVTGDTVLANNGLIHTEMLNILKSVYTYSDNGKPSLKK